MPDWAIRACTILQKWTVRGEDQADYEELDEIRKAFDKASEVFASLILPGSRSLGAGGAKAMQEGFTQEIGEHLARIGFLEREAEQLKSELGEALEESQERQRGHEALVGELEKAKAALEAELDGLRQSVENHLTENRLREEDQAATMQRFEIAESTLRQREEEIEQTRGELARMGDLLTAHEALATDREAELETAREEMEIVSRQAEAARADLRRADQEDIALRQEHAAKVASLEQDHATKFADAMERLKDANYRCQNSQNRIAEQSRESAVMTGLLLEAEQARDHRTEMLDWLAKTDTVLSTVPFWWHLMPARWKARRMHGRLLHHGLFDAKAYLALYPDVVAARIDPLRHFIQHGMNEGRRLTR